MPGKRDRNYKVVKKRSDGDEILLLKKTKKSVWLSKEEWVSIPDTLRMRRIIYQSPIVENEESVLYATKMDEEISKIDVILKYATRWDIEISIKKVKTIMGINIARGKNADMVFKEITTVLTSYNMKMKILAESVDETEFLPKAISFTNALRLIRAYLWTKSEECTIIGLQEDMGKLLKQIKKQLLKEKQTGNLRGQRRLGSIENIIKLLY